MLAFSNDYYGMIFRATQSVELFCAYNRNIVECKVFNIMHDFSVVMTVLIETLWNVKFYNLEVSCLSAIVLIETLWNVKKTK